MNTGQRRQPNKRRKYGPKEPLSSRSRPRLPTTTSKRLQDEAEKDEEERRLESLLFGAQLPASASKGKQKVAHPDGKSAVERSGLGHLADSELFVADFPDEDEPSVAKHTSEGEGTGNHSSSDSSSDTETDAGAEPSSSRPTSAKPAAWSTGKASLSKPSAWLDSSDAAVTVSLKDDKRLRKLRDLPEDDQIGGLQYEVKLREQFEKINPAPAWASAARDKLRNPNPKQKRRRSSLSSQSSSDEENYVEELLHATGSIIDTDQRPSLLPPTKLDILGLRDANQSGRSESEVSSVRFHPSPTVPVLLTAGTDRRLRLFNIDGLTNPILQTIHTPNLPITNAQFHPSGQSILLSGARPYFVTYDLQSGATTESPRGLWSSSSVTEDGKAQGDRSMEIAKFSDDGKLLAVGGRGGYVHLLQCGSSGGGASAQVITSLKMNRPLKDLEWCGSYSGGGNALGETGGSGRLELMTVSNEGQVYIWDVGSRRCVRTWTDESMYGASKVARGGCGKYFAFGSKTGIVNVYGDAAASPQSSSSSETPLKAIQNLVNPITSIRFDPSCQIMAIASKYKPGQLRMVHLPSLTVFSNWPTSSTPLGVVMSVDFSAGSEYFAVGNNRGRVLLYNVKHFGTR